MSYREAAELCRESVDGIEIEHVDVSELPLLNTDLEANGTYPPVVEAFRRKIVEADAFLFASPENNYSVSGKSGNFFYLISPFSVSVVIDAYFWMDE